MIQNVVVVGGGTAGWMTANYLKVALPDVSITVVESANVGTIGVGEATFSTITHFFDYLGLTEPEWMPHCLATYKLGIRFENWNQPGAHFYHPFERLNRVNGFTMADWWLARQQRGRFDADTFIVSSLCDTMRSPRFLDGALFEEPAASPLGLKGRSTLTEQLTQFPYAYHFDAAMLARFLTGFGTRRGIRHVVDDVVDTKQDQRGWIEHVVTREHGAIAGDLFVDCTGFRGLLINKLLEEPFQSYQDVLPNDRAVALRVPVDMPRVGIAPYTKATAQDAGWIWTIPLYGRIGTGYVYSADYCDPDTAERTLREFVGPASESLEANHIRMRIGRNRNSWVNNCVAIGLSSGFVEPLESTGIFFIQHGVEQLVKNFPDAGWDPALRTRYNRLVANCMDGVREFLVLHYYGSPRVDNDYWRATKERGLPATLAERVQEWSSVLPEAESVWPHYHGFEAYSYIAMLLGLGGIPTRPRPALLGMDASLAEEEFAALRRRATVMRDRLPSHYEYIAHLNGDLAGGQPAALPAVALA